MKAFKRFYVWMMNAKLFMAVYFVAVVFLTGIVIAVSGGNSIGLLPLVEMLVVCWMISLLQCALLDETTDYSKGVFFGRSCIWLVISTVLFVGASVYFKWFAGLPSWCPWLLGAFMPLGLSAGLLGLKFSQDIETEKLNENLDRYQQKNNSINL